MSDPNNSAAASLQAQANLMVNEAVGQEIGALTIAKLSAEVNLTLARQQLEALEGHLAATQMELDAIKAAAAAQSAKSAE